MKPLPYFHGMQRANLSLIITHIGSWLLFLSLPVIFITSQENGTGTVDVLLSPYYWLFFAFFISIFYLHTYLLFPKLYRQNRKALYAASVAVIFLLLLWLKPFDKLMSTWRQAPQETTKNESRFWPQPPPDNRFRDQPPPRSFDTGQPPPDDRFRDQSAPPSPPQNSDNRQPPRERNRLDIVSIFMLIIIIAISVSMDVSERLRTASEQATKAEADKANAELSVLKAQINPHFLFNTLNNIYSLAVTGNGNTAESIMKLSNIMRYATDDAPEDFVPLQKEVDCLNDFIDLQRLRIGSKVVLDYSITGNAKERHIAPFILLTFAENVFKYGISNLPASHLIIQLTIQEEGLHFLCSNPLPGRINTDRKGTGIANVKKRLAYLYPDRHTLNISTDNNLYTVQLFVNDKQ